MALVRPFRALRYNLQRITDLASVTSLPYDVLSGQDREDLYRASPYNIVRLIWGKDVPGDGEEENRYVRAARHLREWEAEGILIREECEAFYLYAQDFALSRGPERCRRGILARVRLEDPRSRMILRHESTFPEPEADRLHLMRETEANLDPVFALYEGGGEALTRLVEQKMRMAPLLDFCDRQGVRQRLWILSERSDHEAIEEEVAGCRLFIADGHHRYEAALQYREERMRREGGAVTVDAGYDYILMALIDVEDPGLAVLPVHRLVRGLFPGDLRSLLEKATAFFDVEQVELPSGDEQRGNFIAQRLEGRGATPLRFGLYTGGSSVYFLTPEEGNKGESFRETDRSEASRLDVAILDQHVLDHVLGLEAEREERVAYTHEIGEALAKVQGGAYALALLLRPVSLSQIQAISLAGDRMPQKSTYFYPKLLSGLVINPLDL